MASQAQLQKISEKEATKEINKRDEKLIPITQEVIKRTSEFFIANVASLSGTASDDALKDAETELCRSLLTYFLEQNLTLNEIDVIFIKIENAFKILKSGLLDPSLNESLRRMFNKVFGKDMDELNLGDIDKILKQ